MKMKKKFGFGRGIQSAARRKKAPNRVKVDDNDPICLICLKAFNERFRDEGLEAVGSGWDAEVHIKKEASCADQEAPVSSDDSYGSDTIISPLEPASVSEEVGGGGRRTTVFMAFLRVVERYLGIRTDRFHRSAEGKGRFSPLCDECFHSVRKLCEVYGELENVGMKLGWRLAQISKTIKNSKLSVPGSKASRLSTRLEVFSPTSVGLFRNQVALRCSEKANSVRKLPDVSIDRNSCLNAMKHKLKFPVREMEQCLKTLIFIFALAKKKEEDSVNTHNQLSSRKDLDEAVETKAEVDCNDYEGPTSDVDDAFQMAVDSPEPASSCGEWEAEDSEMTSSVLESNPGVHEADGQHARHKPKSLRWNLRKRTKKLIDVDEGVNQVEDKDSNTDPVVLSPKFSSDHCSRSFTVRHGLKVHLARGPCSLLSGFPYKCKKCQQQFKRAKELKAHTAKFHFIDKRFIGIPTPCSICQEMLPSRKKMIVHLQNVHAITNQEEFTCETCGVVVKGKSQFDSHLKRHASHPCQCTKCPRDFATQAGLQLHMTFHERNPNWTPPPSNWTRKAAKSILFDSNSHIRCSTGGCKLTFTSQSAFEVHSTLHLSSFTCSACNDTCDDYKEMISHLTKVHESKVGESDEKSWICEHCNKSFYLEQTFQFHKKVRHPYTLKFSCDVDFCPDKFDTVNELREHLKADHLGAAAEVEVIQDLDEALQAHKTSNEATGNDEKEDAKLFTCKRCNWSYTSRIRLLLHLFVHSEPVEKKYPCRLCEQKFGGAKQLQTHFNWTHGPEELLYSCLTCKQKFKSDKHLAYHMKMHYPETSSKPKVQRKQDSSAKAKSNAYSQKWKKNQVRAPVNCTLCAAQFKTIARLRGHENREHGIENKTIKCTFEGCSRTFYDRALLCHHLKYHQEKRWQCPLCPKKFFRNTAYLQHQRVHKQEKNHVCQYCGRMFVAYHSWKIHLDIHRGIKNFKCSYCEKAFCRKFALECHERTHTKEKPFMCKFCGKGFSTSTAVKTHEKIHEKLKSNVIVRRLFRETVGAEEGSTSVNPEEPDCDQINE